MVWPYNVKFSNFFPSDQKNLFGSGQKVSGSMPGWPLIYCRSKVCLCWVGSGPISTFYTKRRKPFRMKFLRRHFKCTFHNRIRDLFGIFSFDNSNILWLVHPCWTETCYTLLTLKKFLLPKCMKTWKMWSPSFEKYANLTFWLLDPSCENI